MARIDFRTPRLYLDAPLRAGAMLSLDRDQGHYLTHVLRLQTDAAVLVFNGCDGEWRARLADLKPKPVLTVTSQTRPQDSLPDIRYAFAPLKHARLDYMVQKAVELGACALLPVITQHTQVGRINSARMRANVIEAAEQCGILSLAVVAEAAPLARFLSDRESSRLLVFCDEEAERAAPVAALEAASPDAGIDVLVGPEGGFAEAERTLLMRQPRVLRLSLGPRILRADTAAVAALTLVMATHGDWR